MRIETVWKSVFTNITSFEKKNFISSLLMVRSKNTRVLVETWNNFSWKSLLALSTCITANTPTHSKKKLKRESRNIEKI